MKQMTLKLDSLQQRPVVIVGNGMTALLDTGAYIPVWTDDESILEEKLGKRGNKNMLFRIGVD